MNCKNNTKIILLLSIGLLLIPGCHKSATAEDISLTAEDVVLNDPFLTTLFYSKETIITSDVLQSIKNKEEFKTMYAYCKTPYYLDLAMDLGEFILGISEKEEIIEVSDLIAYSTHNTYILNIGLNILVSRNDCISKIFSSDVNFPIINGLLYFGWGWKKYSAIATLEDYIKNKQIIRENYLENENTNVKLDMILVTGKIESKGYTRPADYNEDVYSLVLQPEAMSGIKVIALSADRESTEIMQEANIGENYRLQCDISGHKHRIIEEGDSKELVYTIKQCNPLTPERFNIKPDQIESVTNYLNDMKQCKHNELYFDGKCLDLSQNSPELPNPGNSKPQNSEPTPPPTIPAELSHEDTEDNADDVIQASQPTDSTCDGLDFYGQCAKLKGTITFGSYPQETDTPEPIEWRVLDMNDEGQILILSNKVLDVKPYNTTDIGITWEKSTIRSWLNGYPASYNTVGTDFTHDNFINVAFTAEEQAKIVASTVPADANPNYDTYPGNATTDKIFLLSIVEEWNYFSSYTARQADATRYAVKKGVVVVGSKSKEYTADGTCTDVHCYASFWLRSPGYDTRHPAHVLAVGTVDYIGYRVDYVNNGIRPAMWVTLAKRAYSEPTPPPTIPNVSNSVKSTQSIPSTGEQARVADIPPVPTLIPAPAVTNPPEQRLKFKKSLKTKKGKVEYLIFHDNQLNTDCYISMLQNQEVLNNQHYCIPFSGNLKELVHPLSLTQTAQQFDSYSYCTNISIEKRNIPGLANFFKAFNPSFYEAKLKRFIDNPFQIIKPLNTHKAINNCNGQCSPHEEECYQMFFSTKPGCNLFQAAQEDRLTNEMLYYCKLSNPFITFEQYMQYNLTPGDIFLTASAKKGEKVLHQYWQVFDRTSPELQFDGTPEEIFEGNTCKNQYRYYNTTIVQVKDLSSKDTYDVLHPAILQAMNVRDKYCKAFNNTLINEARAGNYALVDSGSPLLKKK